MGLWITLRVAVWSVLACWGWDGRCALQSENYMNVCSVCAQDYTHRRRVTRVTNVREVFFAEITGAGRGSALGALPNAGGELLDVIEDLTALGHFGQDLALGVHDRGVVAPECLADLG